MYMPPVLGDKDLLMLKEDDILGIIE